MTDLTALHRAILSRPDDDTVRLAYADAMEENGDPDMAAFIRHGVESARHGPEPRRFGFGFSGAEVMRPAGPDYWTFTSIEHYGDVRVGERVDVKRYRLGPPRGRPVAPLKRREDRESVYHGLLVVRVNLTDDGYEYVVKRDDRSGPWKGAGARKRERELFDGELGRRLRDRHPYMRHTVEPGTYHGRADRCCLYRRGFIERVALPAEDWLKHADDICWSKKKCEACVGNGHGGEGTNWAWRCGVCWGEGAVPRPFLPTFHPVRKVVLTTPPEAHATAVWRQREWRSRLATRSSLWGSDVLDLYRDEWGVEFDLLTTLLPAGSGAV